MIVSVPFDMRKEFIKDTFSEINKFPNKEPINFCKCYDNLETFHLFLQSNYFINPTVWCLVLGVNFMTTILVIISCHMGI